MHAGCQAIQAHTEPRGGDRSSKGIDTLANQKLGSKGKNVHNHNVKLT